ncbi:MAG: hypothetical protein V4795_11920 [Pseudomonadota bacterium]
MNSETKQSTAIQQLAVSIQELLSRPKHPADHISLELNALLVDMYRASPDDPPHERFLNLCQLVLRAFSDGDRSREAIANNPVTPLVIDYLLRAFEDYVKRADRNEFPRTPDRYSGLASAMLLSGMAGKKATIWNLQLQMAVVSAGAGAYEAVMLQSARDDAAHCLAFNAAIKAACSTARCRPDGTLREFNSGEKRAVRAKVVQLLAQQGYKKDWPQRMGERVNP